MTFEALQPLRLRTQTMGSVDMKPGDRLTWPDEAVRQLMSKIPQKIRVIRESSAANWQQGWRQLADWSREVSSQNLFKSMKLLDQADAAFMADDWPAFQGIAKQFHKLINEKRKAS